MNREVAVFKGKKYKAIKGANEIFLTKNQSAEGFHVSPYDKELFKMKVQKDDVTELYREYFMARYKDYELFVVGHFKDSKEIEIVTVDPNVGRECNLDYQDRDFFTKRLGPNDDYQLIYVKEDYLRKTTTRKEVTLEESYVIDNEKFE
ncbi:hypothetical protein V7152_26240 [Neobacillus drentensis]|uniref:hypothetical protein n=1 Tax=Neobacillus drentensis TaxID=220684 RepID=UPI0030005E22